MGDILYKTIYENIERLENSNTIQGNWILFLTNNENAYGLYHWIKRREPTVLFDKKLYLEHIKKCRPQLIISYNYDYIIGKDVIDYMQGNIVNLHISLLPWNRGFSPNIWSFIDNTPKGVTIHQINEKLDEGDIMYQKEIFFDAFQETFVTTYNMLNEVIVELFMKNWESIRNGTYSLTAQVGRGTSHTSKDLKKLKEHIPFQWTDKISDFLEKYEKGSADR